MGVGSQTEVQTMKTITASYWLPLQVREPKHDTKKYTGYAGRDHEPVEELMSGVTEDLEDVLGNVAGAHYVNEKVTSAECNACTFHIQVVITGVVAGDADADDNAYQHWPREICEWVKVRADEEKHPEVYGYDLNPVMEGPQFQTYNTEW